MNRIVETWFDENRRIVERLAKEVFDHPEVSSEERYACRITAAFLEEAGFSVKKITQKRK